MSPIGHLVRSRRRTGSAALEVERTHHGYRESDVDDSGQAIHSALAERTTGGKSFAQKVICVAMFDSFLSRWNLVPDGDPMITNSGRLRPVRFGGKPAMLKLATEEEECFGGVLMEWRAGDGGARRFRPPHRALLVGPAGGRRQLADIGLT